MGIDTAGQGAHNGPMTQYLIKRDGRWLTADYNWTRDMAMAARYSLCGAAHIDAARYGGVVIAEERHLADGAGGSGGVYPMSQADMLTAADWLDVNEGWLRAHAAHRDESAAISAAATMVGD